ncbi:O-methyltransferase [Apiospora hydei]|uniref:O-methyltransferase n=1 Tax=Apiospora hydei TaxID=1337664 RepID=A0ABR1V4Z8_9PEZI
MSTNRIVELSSRIAANTTKLNDYLASNNLPAPSFDLNGPTDTLIPKENAELEAARVAVIDDTLELRRLVLGPREYLMSYTHDEVISQQAIVRFRLAQYFPVGSEATFAEIATTCELNETITRQFLRHATVKGIFTEPRRGVVSHNAVSRLLAEDEVIRDWVGASYDDLWQAAAHTCEAISKYLGSEEPNEAASRRGFSVANGMNKSVYEIFAENPERARRFGNAMRSFTEGTGFELSHVVNNYPWVDHANGRMVDVGGSQGFVSIALARQFPTMEFVVQDLPPVVESAKSAVPADVSDRVHFMAHDFLTEQPVKGADVYFFRWILHNWSDKYCIKILRNHIPALKKGAKIVINDNVLPEPAVMSNWQESRLRSMDLTMTEIQNAHERELDDWKQLIHTASPGFKFQWAKQPPGSNLWIMVVEWQGNDAQLCPPFWYHRKG